MNIGWWAVTNQTAYNLKLASGFKIVSDDNKYKVVVEYPVFGGEQNIVFGVFENKSDAKKYYDKLLETIRTLDGVFDTWIGFDEFTINFGQVESVKVEFDGYKFQVRVYPRRGRIKVIQEFDKEKTAINAFKKFMKDTFNCNFTNVGEEIK